MQIAKGGQYAGFWKDDERDGCGIYSDLVGNVYAGNWSRGKLVRGQITYTNGDIMSGELRDGRFYAGWVRVTLSNNQKYEGQWLAG